MRCSRLGAVDDLPMSQPFDVYLERAPKRTFAGALDWPGWCRSGRYEASALKALLDYAPRYSAVLRSARLGFHSPANLSALVVVERLKGNTTTDFGAPGIPPARDSQPVDGAELRRLQKVLKACWQYFDGAIGSARGKPLQTGPRGGGRDRQKMIDHVLRANQGYLSSLGWKFPLEAADATRKADGYLSASLARGTCRLGTWRAAGSRPSWWAALVASLLYPSSCLAHPRPRLGDRRPPAVSDRLLRPLHK